MIDQSLPLVVVNQNLRFFPSRILVKPIVLTPSFAAASRIATHIALVTGLSTPITSIVSRSIQRQAADQS